MKVLRNFIRTLKLYMPKFIMLAKKQKIVKSNKLSLIQLQSGIYSAIVILLLAFANQCKRLSTAVCYT